MKYETGELGGYKINSLVHNVKTQRPSVLKAFSVYRVSLFSLFSSTECCNQG